MMQTVTAGDIAGWESDLEALTDGLGRLFARAEPKATFAAFVRGLLADVPRKNSWELAEYAGYDNPKPFEHLLDAAVWDVEELRRAVRDLAVEHLGDGEESVLVIDDTQAIKQGKKSVGVAYQHCGATGRTENCQAWVMLTLASRHGHTFIDRELYMPSSWTDDPDRCAKAGVPASRAFATKPALAVAMLRRALDEGVPIGWVADDSGYGRDPDLRQFCHDNALRYVMAVPVDLPLVEANEPSRCDKVLARTGDELWERRSCGGGTKGIRHYDWAFHKVHVKGQDPAPGFEHTLMIRRWKGQEGHQEAP